MLTILTLLLLILICGVIFFLYSLYLTNYFISYRPDANIRTEGRKALTFKDYFTMLVNMYNNQYFTV